MKRLDEEKQKDLIAIANSKAMMEFTDWLAEEIKNKGGKLQFIYYLQQTRMPLTTFIPLAAATNMSKAKRIEYWASHYLGNFDINLNVRNDDRTSFKTSASNYVGSYKINGRSLTIEEAIKIDEYLTSKNVPLIEAAVVPVINYYLKKDELMPFTDETVEKRAIEEVVGQKTNNPYMSLINKPITKKLV